ncbi:MAG: hypothetical protein LAO79_10210 [Acidobacteriia bacterium]|nr:hypothetical protein [Terriglobia bacterium]
MAYLIQLADSQLFLFKSGSPGVPVAVIMSTEKGRSIFWYGEYEEVPFDPKLFAKPQGLKVEELK